MTRAGCKLSFLSKAYKSLGRRLPLFGASKMTPSGPRWTNYSTRRSFDKNVNHISCAAFLKLVSFEAHSHTPQGFDIPLLWVPRGHVARASAVLGGTLTGCGPIDSFFVYR